MMKANNWLYNTTDSGRTWTLVAKGSALRNVGADNIGPYAVNASESVVMAAKCGSMRPRIPRSEFGRRT